MANINKKDLVEKIFIDLISRMGMEIPNNYEDIVQYIFEDILDCADDNFSEGDVVIGFRRFIEQKN